MLKLNTDLKLGKFVSSLKIIEKVLLLLFQNVNSLQVKDLNVVYLLKKQ